MWHINLIPRLMSAIETPISRLSLAEDNLLRLHSWISFSRRSGAGISYRPLPRQMFADITTLIARLRGLPQADYIMQIASVSDTRIVLEVEI